MINLCSKLVFNAKAEYLQKVLFLCLNKASTYNLEVILIIIYRASTNSKVMRNLLKEQNSQLVKK